MKKINKLKGILAGTIANVICLANTVMVMAAPLDEVTKPFENIKSLMITLTSSIGVVWMVISLVQFAFAFNEHDSQGKQKALKGMGAAGLLIAIGPVLAFVVG